MRVCYFGTYSLEEGYPRNRVIIEGLSKNGIDVVECHEDLWGGTSDKLAGIQDGFSIITKLLRILQVYFRLIIKYRGIGKHDAIIVGYAGHIDIFLAKLLNLFKRKPLIFDVFLSIYDTAVVDRAIVPSGSVRAKLLHMTDAWSCWIADAVLLDTPAHIDYFVSEFSLPAGKFHAIPVGSSLPVNNTSGLSSSKNNKFTVLYFGSYIPLHGVDIILKAAGMLQETDNGTVGFTLVGTGQLLPEMKGLATGLGLKNVTFIDRFVKESELAGLISNADICLGIFGKSDKALRVIPCKVYNCLAAGKPLITARTLATDSVLTHNKNVYFCDPGDPASLAKAVLALKDNESLRNKIAQNGMTYFNNNFSADAIGRKVAEIIQGIAD
ncbi:MAG: glycosyltransferase family 4 protein [Nitrospirae bacterium]|nr:glycosyltransferase family 4 protein [Nitrospirota bacterium]